MLYWLCIVLITKRIYDNVVFFLFLTTNTPPEPTTTGRELDSNTRTSSLRPPVASPNKPPTPLVSPVSTAAKVKPAPSTVAKQPISVETKRDLKPNTDKNVDKKDESLEPFDPKKWMVEFAAPLPEKEANERKICFITCSYANDADDMDPLVLVKNNNPKYVRFYLFSNLNDEEWSTPGWTKIVTHYNYTRRITHSRYGKFLSWKYPEIRNNCDAVFYMDSVLRPNSNKTLWDNIATAMLNDNYDHVMEHKRGITDEEIRNTITNNATNTGNLSEYLTIATGFMQHHHPRNRTGIYNEIQAIQWAKKDFKKNVKALMNWFRKQPEGFDWFTPVYLNQAFGYNPNSKVFQLISESFWEHYSKEIDSWRDQPLWSFMLRRYLVKPTIFPYPQELLWKELELENFGHGNHEYQSEADVKM